MTAFPAFDQFFAALWELPGKSAAAFPWQIRLAEAVTHDGWPEVIALPTGCGKTSVIDIWCWALARGAVGLGVPQPRRLFFVIDRRIVVDDVFARGQAISDRLQRTEHLAPVVDALMALGGDTPIAAARLRGGLEIDRAWAANPVQPMLCASTVDQVGSRLLFRGYGLSQGVKNQLAIHAGLVGNDALIVLDEAHLSAPFEATLRAVARERERSTTQLNLPWSVVTMTATPREPGADVFGLDDADHRDDRLRRRLDAPKPTRLVKAKGKKGGTEPVAEACVSEVESLLAEPDGPKVVGVVVNRVARARLIAERLEDPARDVLLLIGPSRPHDRDEVIRTSWGRLASGRTRRAGDRPLVLVATQTIEVGVDIDLDALVTECASWEALRQRFGRLDRLGEMNGGARAAIVESPSTKDLDPIYGAALDATWKFLTEVAANGFVDLGVSASPQAPDETRGPAPNAPFLFPAYVDRWCQTSPIPTHDVSTSEFLHGPDDRPADVEIVWRADLDPKTPESWKDVVAANPPLGREAIRVHPGAVRRWLDGTGSFDVSDAEGQREAAFDLPAVNGACRDPRLALRWRGPSDEQTETVRPGKIRPGDRIVVPATYGGCDEFGWAPEQGTPVCDILESVALEANQPLLRLHEAILHQHGLDLGLLDALVVTDDEGGQPMPDRDAVTSAVVAIAAGGSTLADAAEAVLKGTPSLYSVGAGGPGVGDLRVFVTTRDTRPTDEDSLLVGARKTVTLDRHSSDVARYAKAWADLLGFGNGISEAIEFAALHHDDGKRDPRFQAFLYGGAPPFGREVVAKSPASRRGWKLRPAFAASGLPRGYRHETTSLALIRDIDTGALSADQVDLVACLIATHHGCARPFAPVSIDSDRPFVDTSDLMRIDGEVPERFWRLTRTYGWWGLAALEMVLRLADHRASADEDGTRTMVDA